MFARPNCLGRLVLTLIVLAGLTVWSAAAASAAGNEPRPQRLLLLGQGADGHPQGTHEYMQGLNLIQKMLAGEEGLQVEIIKADEPWTDGPEQLAQADAVVVFLAQGATWLNKDPRRRKAFEDFAARGGGLVVLHWGMGTKDAKDIEPFVNLFGACHGGPDRRYKVLETDVAAANHPIAQGIGDFRLKDEFYYALKRVKAADRLQPVLRANIDGNWEMVAWAWERPGGGRSFGFSGLHFHSNWEQPQYRTLVRRGILWTLDRLNK